MVMNPNIDKLFDTDKYFGNHSQGCPIPSSLNTYQYQTAYLCSGSSPLRWFTTKVNTGRTTSGDFALPDGLQSECSPPIRASIIRYKT